MICPFQILYFKISVAVLITWVLAGDLNTSTSQVSLTMAGNFGHNVTVSSTLPSLAILGHSIPMLVQSFLDNDIVGSDLGLDIALGCTNWELGILGKNIVSLKPLLKPSLMRQIEPIKMI